MSGAALHVKAVCFDYEDMAMRFDLSVNAGEFIGIIGPSGAGKTTLLNLIAGFEEPVSGTVLIDGSNVTASAPGARPVTMVFQDHNLFAHLDVNANVGLGLSPALALSEPDKQRISGALARVGLEGFEHRLPGQLSGGERQRVALARALVRDKPVLLLDEPFASLGPALSAHMLDLVARLQQQDGLTVLMVTHRPGDARAVAGKVAFVHAGRILQFSPCEDFFSDTGIPEIRQYLGQQ